MSSYLAIDLFCGCGGMTQGLKSAGFSVTGAIEIDPVAASAYSANHPEVKLWQKDIQDITVDAVKQRLRLRQTELDLLAGCPPCQGFSSMRTRNGHRKSDDPRNDLIDEFARLAEGLLPKAIMLENVPELRDDDRFARFCAGLEGLGYTCNHDVLDAARYGVPQRRERLILLAGLFGMINFADILPNIVSVRHTIAALPLPGATGDPIHDFPENRKPLTIERIKHIPKNGGSRTALPERLQLACHKDCDGFKDVYGRMAWDDVAPTLTGGCFNPSKGRFLHPEQDRAITMREAALLQTFPPKYQFPADRGKTSVAMMIGNALPPEFIRRQATCVRRYLEQAAS
jgi:DNA (cytosine-5)-methyltransferase 1